LPRLRPDEQLVLLELASTWEGTKPKGSGCKSAAFFIFLLQAAARSFHLERFLTIPVTQLYRFCGTPLFEAPPKRQALLFQLRKTRISMIYCQLEGPPNWHRKCNKQECSYFQTSRLAPKGTKHDPR
jgi:hypothetical protein